MMYFYFCALLIVAFTYVLSIINPFDDPESLLLSCNLGDMECLRKSTDMFLKQTYMGIPSHDILPIDPVKISLLEVAFDKEGLLYQNTNVTVTGLRYQKIHDFKMYIENTSVVLVTSADLNIRGEITILFTDLLKSKAGHFSSDASVLGTAAYTYELITDEAGVEHFEVAPETISCEVVRGPVVELNPELEQALSMSSDGDTEAFCPEKMNELWQKNFCKIAEKAFVNVIHNIRAAAKVLPSSAFFKNLHD